MVEAENAFGLAEHVNGKDVMDKIGRRLKHYWDSLDLESAPGVSDHNLEAFECRYDVRLPGDLREYFSVVNGTGHMCGEPVKTGTGQLYDHEFFSFWPLELVRPLNQDFPEAGVAEHESFFLFADHSIWAPVFAIKLSRDRTVTNVVINLFQGGGIDREVSNSFSEFVEDYLRDHFSLH
jgi:hypothetical protein